MGTSVSSKGPGGGIPMVPPWVSDPNGAPDPADAATNPTPVVLAPRARFGGARRAMGDFARSGNPERMRRGLSRYTSRGLGGSAVAAQRMAGAAARSGALFGALRGEGGTSEVLAALLDTNTLAGRPAMEIVDAIVDVVCPGNGTQDMESSQRAVNDALSDLLDLNPDVDLTALSVDDIDFVLERHLAYEVDNRLRLDIGQAVVRNATTPAAGMERLNEIRDYIVETVAFSFRNRRAQGTTLSATDAAAVSASALRDAYAVFEEYTG